jgi:crotonobetainyl-CoA:carnitine CoA-transferase CaiB-like acyl-CoA transferase
MNEVSPPTARPSQRPASADRTVRGPLNGLRVIELGHFIAAPFATRVLADLGAEVIKVEPPDGDPARDMGQSVDGRSIWWSVHARNKKCITLNLKQPEGRQLLRELVRTADALVENFRPGQLEAWGLGFDILRQIRSDLILVRITGFGQDGPYRDKVAFGVIGEALGGIRHLTGYPRDVADLPPVRVGVSFGDSVAGLYGVIGLLSALYERSARAGSAEARCVDVALYEAVFSLMEGALPEYGHLGVVREPAGSALPTVAPSNTYRSADGHWVCVAANSDRIFVRLMRLIDRQDLTEDDRFRDNQSRLAHRKFLDELIGEWIGARPAGDVERLLESADVPASRIYTIADCASDPHFKARGMINDFPDPRFGSLLHPGVVPKFADSGPGGGIGWAGPEIGAHNAEILTGMLGLSDPELERLRQAGVIR